MRNRQTFFISPARAPRARVALLLLASLSFAANVFGQASTTNAPTAVSSAVPEVGGSVLRVFGALALVIALFLGGVWLFRNWQRFVVRKNGAPKLNVLEVKSLGQRQALFVVGYEQQRMLLASSPTGITLLSHLPTGDEEEVTETVTPRVSFAEAFQQIIHRKS